MRILKGYVLLLGATALLSGFSWGFGGDSCKDALELADTLETMRDDLRIRQTEEKIDSLCTDAAIAHYVAALKQERLGNIEGAAAEYRQALQLQSSFSKASGNLGVIYARQGKNEEASVALSRGLAGSPNPRYHKALGRIMADMKAYPLALYHLEEAAAKLPNDADLFVNLAEVRMAMGQSDKAVEEYNRALTADSNSERPYLGLARAYLGRNEPDKALEVLKRGELVQPQNRQLHKLKGDIFKKKGDEKQASYEYLLAGKARPSAIQATKSQPVEPVSSADPEKEIETIKNSPYKTVEMYEKLGHLYRQSGKDGEAIAAYRDAIYNKSTNSNVYLYLGIIYEKQQKQDEAVVAYKQALQLKPDNADARLRLADIRNERGYYQDAVEQYAEFLKLKPDSPDIQLKMARILAKTREYGLAIDAYAGVLKNLPDNADANREIAALYRVKGINDKAIEHYKKPLAQQKDDLESRSALVSLYVKNKQYDEITDLLKGTVELFPDDPNNHYKLGLIYEFRKDYENAISSYKKAAELKPDHARSLNALGRLYMKTGRISEAKAVLEAAKKADPNLEETTVLLNNIRDEFNPEPRGINKSLKGSRSRKIKKSKKATKSSKGSKSSKSSKSSKKTKKTKK